MQGDEGYKIVGNMAIEAKSNSARIGLLNVLVSQFNTGRTTFRMIKGPTKMSKGTAAAHKRTTLGHQ